MKNNKMFQFVFLCLTSMIMMFIASACQMSTMSSGKRIKETVAGIDFYLRYVPEGTFTVQSGGPQATITNGYYMAETEVTQELWTAVRTGSDNNITPSNFSGSPDINEQQGKRPVEKMTWYDAIEFCNRLSSATGRADAYDLTVPARNGLGHIGSATVAIISGSDGYRLPTEMEWMWAAMGAENPDGGYAKKYAGGPVTNTVKIEDFVWYSVNSNSRTHQVGLKNANELGLYVMSGNVNEWCWDGFLAYPNPMYDDYRGDNSATTRVFRGGSYSNVITTCTVDFRDNVIPGSMNGNIGFRVVCP